MWHYLDIATEFGMDFSRTSQFWWSYLNFSSWVAIFCIRAIKELYSCWGIVRRSMWAASCLASCCASCACAACTGVVGSISRRSARIAYCGLFALSLIVSWILRDFAGPLLAKIPCKFFLLCLSYPHLLCVCFFSVCEIKLTASNVSTNIIILSSPLAFSLGPAIDVRVRSCSSPMPEETLSMFSHNLCVTLLLSWWSNDCQLLLSVMEVMVLYFVSNTLNVMTTLILVLVWPEFTQCSPSSCICGVFFTISWIIFWIV